MNTIRKFNLEKCCCWVFTIGFAIMLIILVAAIVMGLTHSIINTARGESNTICFKGTQMNKLIRSKRMIVVVNEVRTRKD